MSGSSGMEDRRAPCFFHFPRNAGPRRLVTGDPAGENNTYWREGRGACRFAAPALRDWGQPVTHLFLAILWFFLGVMFLVWSWTAPEGRIVRVGESGLDVAVMGWVALGLGIWNTVRWWLSRANAARQRAFLAAAAHRPQRHHPDPDRPRDPNFVFTDPPPAPPTDRPEGQG